jgi:beta-lactamase class A
MSIIRFIQRSIAFPIAFLISAGVISAGARQHETALHESRSQASALHDKIQKIALEVKGKAAVACLLQESTLNCDFNANARPPMQSVFKLPLALTVLHQIEQGFFSPDQFLHFRPEDLILLHVYSPLQDKYPEGNVDVSIAELLRLTVSLSDNVAADIWCGPLVGQRS